MLTGSDLVAFIGSTELVRARLFYEGVLGLPVLEVTPYAVAFDAHGTTLRVTAVHSPARAQYTVLGWTVADITATAAQLAAAGVPFLRFDGMEQDEHGVWTAPSGARIAWFQDPDGNTLSITER